MLEKMEPRRVVKQFLVAGLVGILSMLLCMAGTAMLMASNGYSAASAGTMAMISLCMGSLCSGLTAALMAQSHRMLLGMLQGVFLTGLLMIASMVSGSPFEAEHLMHFAAGIFCGTLGGVLGILKGDRRRI